MNNLRFLYVLILSCGIILTGCVFIFFESAWSFRQRHEVVFLSSPIREIVGVFCILWGAYFLFDALRKLKQKK